MLPALTRFFFFFSSRRRHTRYWRDWSSDVCSSDLGRRALGGDDVTQLAVGAYDGEYDERGRDEARGLADGPREHRLHPQVGSDGDHGVEQHAGTPVVGRRALGWHIGRLRGEERRVEL